MRELFDAWRCRNRLALLGFSEESVRILDLRKRRKGVQCLRAETFYWSGPNFDIEKPDVRFVASIITRFNLDHTPLVLDLPGSYFRHRLMQLPDDCSGQASDWLEENISQGLPPGLTKSQVSYGFQMTSNTNASQALLVTFGRKEMMDTWADVVRVLGLRVLAIRADPCSILQAGAFLDARYHSENWAFLHFAGKTASVLVTQHGELKDYSEWSPDVVDLEAQSSEALPNGTRHRKWSEVVEPELARLKAQGLLDRIVVFGERADETALPYLSGIAPVLLASTLVEDLIPNEPVNDYATLFGLGVNQLYPQAESVDLLPAPHRAEVRERANQIKTLSIGMLAAIVFVGLWLVVATGDFFVSRELRSWGEEISKLQTQITRIESLKEKGERLSHELALSQKIRSRQSRVARGLWQLAGKMPKNVWLRELRYGVPGEQPSPDGSSTPFQLEGLALDQNGPTQLLANLEKMPDFEAVQIDLLELIPAAAVLKKTKLHKRPLVRFKLSASFRT